MLLAAMLLEALIVETTETGTPLVGAEGEYTKESTLSEPVVVLSDEPPPPQALKPKIAATPSIRKKKRRKETEKVVMTSRASRKDESGSVSS